MDHPTTIPYKIFMFNTLITAVILHVFYNAYLTTVLSSPKFVFLHNNLNDLYMDDNTWTFGIMNDSYLLSFFKVSCKSNGIFYQIVLLLDFK